MELLLIILQIAAEEPTGLRSLNSSEIAQGVILGLLGYWLWRRAKRRRENR